MDTKDAAGAATATNGQPEFVSASRRPSDPVGRIGDDHGFWDETWTTWHGGHADEAAARAACRSYAEAL